MIAAGSVPIARRVVSQLCAVLAVLLIGAFADKFLD